MTPHPQKGHEQLEEVAAVPPKAEAAHRAPIAWAAPEFEQAILFNMDGGQRAAHAAKMQAEATQINANARNTTADAVEKENRNWKVRLCISAVHCLVVGSLLAVGVLIGLVVERYGHVVPW